MNTNTDPFSFPPESYTKKGGRVEKSSRGNFYDSMSDSLSKPIPLSLPAKEAKVYEYALFSGDFA